ncbi:MAG: DUF5686 family protein [Chitinophagales bacterium]
MQFCSKFAQLFNSSFKSALKQSTLSIAILLFLLLGSTAALGQTRISGTVQDAYSGELLPFANITFKGSTTGTSSDMDGAFYLEGPEKFDSIQVSLIGYATKNIRVEPGKRQKLEVKLDLKDYSLDEIVVLPGENPAWEILRRVIANKPNNDPEQYNSFSYEVFEKIQFDLNHFTDKIKKNILLRPFPFIWENVDTTKDGVNYLPFLYKEKISDYYYRKNPKAEKEIIKAERDAKFFEGPKITDLIDDLYVTPNIYQNYVIILDKSFPSPLNNNYKWNYKFYLEDSTYIIDGLPCLRIDFVPRGDADVAFTGHMYIHDSTYAVKEMDLHFSIEANINFVRNFDIHLEYQWIDNKHWFLKENTVLADFSVIENSPELTGFFGRKTATYKNITIDSIPDPNVFKGIGKTIKKDSAKLRSDEYWNDLRGDSLSKKEQDIFTMTDSIKNSPPFNRIKKVFKSIVNSYIPIGPEGHFEIGNFYSFYSFNRVEGHRLKTGFRTRIVDDRIRLKAYTAYGVWDKRWKYFGQTEFYPELKPGKHTMVGLQYKLDQEQLGRSERLLSIDHILNSLVQFGDFRTRIMVDDRRAYLEKQWFTGFSTRIDAYNKLIYNFDSKSFLELNGENKLERVYSYNSSGLALSMKYVFGEEELAADFNEDLRGFFMLKYPILGVLYENSFSGILGSNIDFHRLKLQLEHQFRLNKWGYFNYRIEAGKVWGTVPYPFLEVPTGNQNIINDDRAFNLMNFMEFANDEFLVLHMEHHFDGLIFNRIPGVNKLKLRSLIFGRVLFGRLSTDNNQDQYLFPPELKTMNKPYAEVGFGIENILKVSRVDFTWRINYTGEPDVYRFIAKPSFYFKF